MSLDRYNTQHCCLRITIPLIVETKVPIYPDGVKNMVMFQKACGDLTFLNIILVISLGIH